MSTSRRQFLQTLAGLAVAPFALSRALAAPKAAPYVITPQDEAEAMARIVQVHERFNLDPRAIKVPSNRRSFAAFRNADGSITQGYLYEDDWDGTFKLEVCDNPAYVLADLMEAQGYVPWANGFDWRVLADWGRYCDELVLDGEWLMHNRRTGELSTVAESGPDGPIWAPRFTVEQRSTNRATSAALRETLSMHYRIWLATDPRYRRSFPGIPYTS